MPAAWQRKYLLGEFGFTPDGQPVYPEYSEKLHRAKETLPVTSGKPILCGWDFGYHFPAVVFTQFDAKNRWLILREIMGKNITVDRFGDYVVQKMRLWFPEGTEFKHYGDPAGNQKTDKSERTSIDILASKGIRIATRVSRIRQGLELVGMQLGKLIDELPGLLVDPGCTVVHEGFSGGYHYPEATGMKPFDENPAKDGYYDHIQDCIRYVAVNVLDMPEPKGREREERITAWEEEQIEEEYRRRANDPFWT
jgi:hypothetical protein